MQGPRLNSIRGLLEAQDELDFVAGRVDLSASGSAGDSWQSAVWVEPGDVVEVRVVVHVASNGTPVRSASNTRVLATPLEGREVDAVVPVFGFVSADDALPAIVSDAVTFYGARPFRLRFFSGSARWRSPQEEEPERVLPDGVQRSVVIEDGRAFDLRDQLGEGALVGTRALNGVLRGSSHAGWVSLRFRVEPA